MNILLIRLSSMGDIILTTPALKILKEKYPQAKVYYLVYEKFAEVIVHSKRLERVISFPKKRVIDFLKKGRFLKAFLLLNKFSQKLRSCKYDFIIDLHNTTDSALLSFWAKGKRRVGHKKQILNLGYHKRSDFSEENHLTKTHASVINLLFLRDAGLINHNIRLNNALVPELEIPRDNLVHADEFYQNNNLAQRHVIGINPCGSYGFKRWSESSFASLADDLLANKEADVLLFAGPGEEQIAKRIAAQMKQSAVVVSGLGLLDVLAIIRKLSLFITNDSGLMHAATSFAVPLVAIFGPTNYLKFAPLGSNSRTVCSPLSIHSKKLKGLKMKTPGELFPGVSENKIISAINSLNI